MSSDGQIFTRLLENLALRGDEAYGDLEAWRALRGLLRRELRRRGLWTTSPSLLGVFGWDRWESSAADSEWRWAGRTPGALDELLVDCFDFTLLTRERSLRAQLAVKGNVEGLITLNVRNFVSERQKQNDPLGTRTFEVLHEAATRLVEGGHLMVLGGDLRIRNETVVGTVDSQEWIPLEVWSENVSLWCRELLPELVTAKASERRLVSEALADRIGSLFSSRPGRLLFRDMISVLKDEVRGRWSTMFAQDSGWMPDGQGESVDRAELPDSLLVTQQNFVALIECVLIRLRGASLDPRTRSYLGTLWEFLRIWALDGSNRSDDTSWNRLPSHRQLAEQLKIPRERLPTDLETLAVFLRECRDRNGVPQEAHHDRR
jgi:hypothetical protein